MAYLSWTRYTSPHSLLRDLWKKVPSLWGKIDQLSTSQRKLYLWTFACRKLIWPTVMPKTRAMIEKGYDWVDGLCTELDVRLAGAAPGVNPDELIPTAALNCAATCADLLARDPDFLDHHHVVMCDLLRDLFGPQEPDTYPILEPSWISPDVQNVAQDIYQEHRWEEVGVLADALEDSGASREILDHLRNGKLHARGCWVVDKILGK